MPAGKVSIEMEATIAKFRTELNSAVGHFNKFGKEIKDHANEIKQSFKSITAGIAGIAAGFVSLQAGKQFLNFVIETNSQVSKLKSHLDILSGSQAKTSEYMDMAAKSAQGVVPDFEEFLQSIIKLKSFGIEPTLESLKGFGNLATIFDKPLTEVVASVNSASLETFKGLKQFGISVSDETDRFVAKFQGQYYEIKKNAKDITDFLVELGNTKFAGAMEAEANTLYGELDSLEDHWRDISRIIGESGFGKAATESLKIFNDFVEDSIRSGVYEQIGISLYRGFELAKPTLIETVKLLNSMMVFAQGWIDFLISGPQQAQLTVLQGIQGLAQAQYGIQSIRPLPSGPAMPDFSRRLTTPFDKEAAAAAKKREEELQKEQEHWASIADKINAANDPLYVYQKTLDEINEAYDRGLISADIQMSAVSKALDVLNEKTIRQNEEWKKTADAIEEAYDPQIKYNKTLKELDLLYGKNLLSSQAYFSATEKAAKELNETLRQTKIEAGDFQANFMAALGDYSKQMDNWGKNVGNAVNETFAKIGDALTNFFTTGKMDWKNFEQAILQDWNAMFVKMLIMNPLKNALFGNAAGGQIGGLIGSLFGATGGGSTGDWLGEAGPTMTPMARGGSVYAGTPILVGERGPEIFRPDVSGQIIPNNQIGGMTINMTIVTPDANSFRRSANQIYQDAFLAGQRAYIRNGG